MKGTSMNEIDRRNVIIGGATTGAATVIPITSEAAARPNTSLVKVAEALLEALVDPNLRQVDRDAVKEAILIMCMRN